MCVCVSEWVCMRDRERERERERERAMGPLTWASSWLQWKLPYLRGHTSTRRVSSTHPPFLLLHTISSSSLATVFARTHTPTRRWRDDPAWGIISTIDSLWSFRSSPGDLPPQNIWQTTCLLDTTLMQLRAITGPRHPCGVPADTICGCSFIASTVKTQNSSWQ